MKDTTSAKRALIRRAKQKPCTDCGASYPSYVMEFDHLPAYAKHFTIGNGTRVTLEALIAELAKCELVCRNCHAERTHARHIAKKAAPRQLTLEPPTPKLAIVPHQSVIQAHIAEMRRIEAMSDAS
jgi:hypothetical protein